MEEKVHSDPCFHDHRSVVQGGSSPPFADQERPATDLGINEPRPSFLKLSVTLFLQTPFLPTTQGARHA
jgi:hypothetical protein